MTNPIGTHSYRTTQIVRTAADVGSLGMNIARAGNPFSPAIGAASLLSGTGTDSDVGALSNLFEQQLAAQREMQATTMQTNISKTQHEARMAAIRNMRP